MNPIDWAALLDKGRQLLAQKRIVAGFDGFVDTIVQVVQEKETGKAATYFGAAEELGHYIVERSGRNLSLELEESQTKLGGNMPIMSHALASLGGQVSCIGALGYPSLHPVFATMATTCDLYSYADPGLSTALEFHTGKIILGQMTTLQQTGWTEIKARIGLPVLISLFKNSDLTALLNWSELDGSTSVWKGLLEEVLPACVDLQHQTVFVDLSDCSKRSENDLREALALLKEFSAAREVILSLNLNEAETLYRLFLPDQPPTELKALGLPLFENLGVHTLVIHHARQASAWQNEQYVEAQTRFLAQPKISTGAGDHFNAGYALGNLMELDVAACLALGNAVSAHYLKTSSSPVWGDLWHELTNKDL